MAVKDKKKAKEKNQELHQNQMRLNRVLSALGVTQLHKTLSLRFREKLLRGFNPPLKLEFSASSPKKIQIWFKSGLEVSWNGVTFHDYHEIMIPLMWYMKSAVGCDVLNVPNESGSYNLTQRFADRYQVPFEEYRKYFDKHLAQTFWVGGVLGSSVNSGYVVAEAKHSELSRFRVKTTFHIGYTPVQASRIDGRLSYRVGAQVTTMGESSTKMEVEWLSRCPLDYGLPGKVSEKLPVYITSHAFSRMKERLDDEYLHHLISDRLFESLSFPACHPMAGEVETLVEFNIGKTSTLMGYLLMSRVGDAIFAKTFLFITMAQTPEGARLYERLRMARLDHKFHGLDKLSTFQNTDIKDNPILVKILNACGYEKFLEWIEKHGHIEVGGSKKVEVAEEIVKYFRLK